MLKVCKLLLPIIISMPYCSAMTYTAEFNINNDFYSATNLDKNNDTIQNITHGPIFNEHTINLEENDNCYNNNTIQNIAHETLFNNNATINLEENDDFYNNTIGNNLFGNYQNEHSTTKQYKTENDNIENTI